MFSMLGNEFSCLILHELLGGEIVRKCERMLRMYKSQQSAKGTGFELE